jgi:hypothetical protein
MTALAELEQQGYRFRLDHDRVMVRGPDHLLTDPAALEQLRQRKPEILAELRLQAFIDLVRSEGACVHRLLFSRAEILAQLDVDAVAELMTTTREQRQSLAADIAKRLADARISPGWRETLEGRA